MNPRPVCLVICLVLLGTSVLAAEPPKYDHWRPLSGPFLAVEVGRYSDLGCARSSDGRVACWGHEVGRRPSAPKIEGTAWPQLWQAIDDAIGLAVAQGDVCVARRSGKVTCLGLQNAVVQPAKDIPLAAVQVVPAGNGFCGRTADGRVGCWGWIDWIDKPEGQVLTWIQGVTGARNLTCIHRACCALDGDGRLGCFGQEHKLLGKLEGKRAKPVLPERRFTQVALDGDKLCGVETGGRLACVADEQTMKHYVPEAWKKRPRARWVGFSDRQACFVDHKGTLVCESELRLAGVEQVSLGWVSGCALKAGAVWCWGNGETGGNGDGGDVTRAVPGRVAGIEGATAISVGAISACALVDSRPHCWGFGVRGQYAFESKPRKYYVELASLARSQYFASCGTKPDGQPWCNFGDGALRFPKKGRAKKIRALALDRGPNICAAGNDGRVRCLFSLGEGGTDMTWRQVAGAEGIVELAPSSVGWCGRTRKGRVVCMQDSRFDNDDDFVDAPVEPLQAEPVAGLAGVEQLTAGQNHYCARLTGGQVECWGSFYLRGFLRSWRSKEPKSIPAFEGATDIAANHFHTCAIKGRKVICWGENDYGQLGDGSFLPRLEPVEVALPAGVKPRAVSVGDRYSCLLDDQGRVWCWGDDSRGLLGTGRVLHSERPVRVVGIGPRKP